MAQTEIGDHLRAIGTHERLKLITDEVIDGFKELLERKPYDPAIILELIQVYHTAGLTHKGMTLVEDYVDHIGDRRAHGFSDGDEAYCLWLAYLYRWMGVAYRIRSQFGQFRLPAVSKQSTMGANEDADPTNSSTSHYSSVATGLPFLSPLGHIVSLSGSVRQVWHQYVVYQ